MRPYLGEPLPEDVHGFDGLLVPGGSPGPLDDDRYPRPPALLRPQEELAALPPEAVLLLGGTGSPHQAFRLGDQAWGTRFHPEATPQVITGWARESAVPRKAGAGADEIIAQLDAVRAETARVWRPVAHRWASPVHQRRKGPGSRTAPAMSPTTGHQPEWHARAEGRSFPLPSLCLPSVFSRLGIST